MSDHNTRARNALRGEWLPGMVDAEGNRVEIVGVEWDLLRAGPRYRDEFLEYQRIPEDACPNLDDRVTLWALVAVLEHRVVNVSVVHLPDARWSVRFRYSVCVGGQIVTRRRSFIADDLAEALLAALEAT